MRCLNSLFVFDLCCEEVMLYHPFMGVGLMQLNHAVEELFYFFEWHDLWTDINLFWYEPCLAGWVTVNFTSICIPLH